MKVVVENLKAVRPSNKAEFTMTCWPWQETRKQQLGPQSSNNKNCSFMLVSFSADSNSGGRRTPDAANPIKVFFLAWPFWPSFLCVAKSQLYFDPLLTDCKASEGSNT